MKIIAVSSLFLFASLTSAQRGFYTGSRPITDGNKEPSLDVQQQPSIALKNLVSDSTNIQQPLNKSVHSVVNAAQPGIAPSQPGIAPALPLSPNENFNPNTAAINNLNNLYNQFSQIQPILVNLNQQQQIQELQLQQQQQQLNQIFNQAAILGRR
jgi:hypothetical protein